MRRLINRFIDKYCLIHSTQFHLFSTGCFAVLVLTLQIRVNMVACQYRVVNGRKWLIIAVSFGIMINLVSECCNLGLFFETVELSQIFFSSKIYIERPGQDTGCRFCSCVGFMSKLMNV